MTSQMSGRPGANRRRWLVPPARGSTCSSTTSAPTTRAQDPRRIPEPRRLTAWGRCLGARHLPLQAAGGRPPPFCCRRTQGGTTARIRAHPRGGSDLQRHLHRRQMGLLARIRQPGLRGGVPARGRGDAPTVRRATPSPARRTTFFGTRDRRQRRPGSPVEAGCGHTSSRTRERSPAGTLCSPAGTSG